MTKNFKNSETIIEKADAYYYKPDSKKLYGIIGTVVKRIDLIDQDGDLIEINDFFMKGGDLYFSLLETETIEKEIEYEDEDGKIKTKKENFYEPVLYHYRQKNEKSELIENLPERPKQYRAHLKHDEFVIEDGKHEDKDYSDVRNLCIISGLERFEMVDNFLHIPGKGLFISVSAGRGEELGIRPKGLYFWECTEKSIQHGYMVAGLGIMWK